MNSEIVALVRTELEASAKGKFILQNIEPLEEALCADPDFMKAFRGCKFDWPGESVPVKALAYWLLNEAELSGDAEGALSKLRDFMAAPHSTWQHAIVCTNVRAQHRSVGEGWEFSNHVVAYPAGLSANYMILTDDQLFGNGLIFLDLKQQRDYSDFAARVTDCCRSLGFVAGNGCFIRPSYYTTVYESSAPHPLGSQKGWLSDRRNNIPTIVTGELFQRANELLGRMQNVADSDLPRLRRVLDRHARAVAWQDFENRAVEARICMEMILMGGTKGDNVFKVSRRAAYLMADEPDQRLIRMKQAKELYDAGSSVVHDGFLRKENHIDAVYKCHEFLDELVIAWLEQNARFMGDLEWAAVELGGAFPD